MTSSKIVCALMGTAGVTLGASAAQAAGTFTTKSLTPELAVKLAQATFEACRAEGF